jgi:hypothetical protein
MDLFQQPLSVTRYGKITVSVYPQLILIERGSFAEKYIGYSKAEAVKLFRKKYKNN